MINWMLAATICFDDEIGGLEIIMGINLPFWISMQLNEIIIIIIIAKSKAASLFAWAVTQKIVPNCEWAVASAIFKIFEKIQHQYNLPILSSSNNH